MKRAIVTLVLVFAVVLMGLACGKKAPTAASAVEPGGAIKAHLATAATAGTACPRCPGTCAGTCATCIKEKGPGGAPSAGK